MMKRFIFGLALSLGAGIALNAAHAQGSVSIYTTYTVNPTSISWVTCGSTQQDGGCYGSGSLAPFGKVCAVLESKKTTTGDTIVQDLYVFDSNYRQTGNVFLRAYKITYVISSSYITTTITPRANIGLPLAGGTKVRCQAAANDSVIAAGTSTSTQAVIINKLSLAFSRFGGFSPPETISSIVADNNGYISINQGSGTGTGFYLLGPNGEDVEDGGGSAVIFNSTNAYIP